MGHSKQNKNKKDGNHRVETREERKERLRKQEEARQVRYFLVALALFAIIPMDVCCSYCSQLNQNFVFAIILPNKFDTTIRHASKSCLMSEV